MPKKTKKSENPQNPEKYEVGYKKPPKDSQFIPGLSGNRKGRPKDHRNTYNMLTEVLDQKISIKENGRDLRISKKLAMIMQLVNKAVKGDVKAINSLLPHMLMADVKEEDKNKILASISQDDREIITNYLKNVSDFDGIEEVKTHD
ncbi:MAG: DUF5681 domain-containing protein [bacterium]